MRDKPQYPERLSLTLSPEMLRALKEARLEDGVEATARIRAMVWAWMHNERHRGYIDGLVAEFIASPWRMQVAVRQRNEAPHA